jgi:hypothetical protein
VTDHVARIEDKRYIKKGVSEEEFTVSILTCPQSKTYRSYLSGCRLLKVNSATRICLAIRIRSPNFEQASFRDRQFTADVRAEQLRLNSRHKQRNFSTQWYPHCSSGPPVFLPGWYVLLFIPELSRSKRKAIIALDCLGLEFAYVYLHIYISKVVPCAKMTVLPSALLTMHIFAKFPYVQSLSHNTTFELLENGADRAYSSEMWCPIDR